MGRTERMFNAFLMTLKQVADDLPSDRKMVANLDWTELGEFEGDIPTPVIEITITKL